MSDAEIMAMSGLADSALQVAGNITASTFNYQHTKELAKWQNDMNIANWQMQNEYNLPVNQMARFRAAGLNPNLIYGQGNPGNAGTVAAASAPSHNEVKNPFEGVAMATQFQQMKNIALQNEKLDIENQRSLVGYHSQLIAFQNAERKLAAIDQWLMDHHEGGMNFGLDIPKFGYGKRSFSIGRVSDLKNSPEYQTLEQLWKRGELTSEQINYMKEHAINESKEGSLLDFQNWQNKGIESLFNDSGELKGAVGMFYKLLLLLVGLAKGK